MTWLTGTNGMKELMNAQEASSGAFSWHGRGIWLTNPVYKTLEHIDTFQCSISKYACFISLAKANYTAKSECKLLESVLFFYPVGPRDWTLALRLCGKLLYLLSHLASPRWLFLSHHLQNHIMAAPVALLKVCWPWLFHQRKQEVLRQSFFGSTAPPDRKILGGDTICVKHLLVYILTAEHGQPFFLRSS